MSFQSIYEQLNNTRLLSKKSSLNSSPYGKGDQASKIAIEAQIRNKTFQITGEDAVEQKANNSVTTIEAETPKTTEAK